MVSEPLFSIDFAEELDEACEEEEQAMRTKEKRSKQMRARFIEQIIMCNAFRITFSM
jgi:hypothetical protein